MLLLYGDDTPPTPQKMGERFGKESGTGTRSPANENMVIRKSDFIGKTKWHIKEVK